VHRLARLAEDHPEIAELDLNPVIADEHGCVAVDARVRVRRPDGLPQPKTWSLQPAALAAEAHDVECRQRLKDPLGSGRDDDHRDV
jgi:hypothetical protein